MTTDPKTLAVYMKQPAVIEKFVDVLGDNNARPYIQSVLIAAASSSELAKCSNESIFRSALRAASLGLSCDPALKQAWIVPYWNNKKKALEAQFQPHYKGLYTLAMRTGKYWQINVSPVYEGQRVFENSLTGLHAVQEESGFIGKPASFNAAYTDVTVRRKANQKIIGWIGYFKTKKGFEKSVWMSSMEIDDHARKYVKEYDKNPNWIDPDKRPVMEMKTVLRQLLSWADLSGTENLQLVEALNAEQEIIESDAKDVEPEQSPALVYEIAERTIVNTAKGERFLTELDVESLNNLYLADGTSEQMRELITLVLAQDYKMEPPAKPKATPEQTMKELGF